MYNIRHVFQIIVQTGWLDVEYALSVCLTCRELFHRRYDLLRSLPNKLKWDFLDRCSDAQEKLRRSIIPNHSILKRLLHNEVFSPYVLVKFIDKTPFDPVIPWFKRMTACIDDFPLEMTVSWVDQMIGDYLCELSIQRPNDVRQHVEQCTIRASFWFIICTSPRACELLDAWDIITTPHFKYEWWADICERSPRFFHYFLQKTSKKERHMILQRFSDICCDLSNLFADKGVDIMEQFDLQTVEIMVTIYDDQGEIDFSSYINHLCETRDMIALRKLLDFQDRIPKWQLQKGFETACAEGYCDFMLFLFEFSEGCIDTDHALALAKCYQQTQIISVWPV
jgi:hypothetical protein